MKTTPITLMTAFMLLQCLPGNAATLEKTTLGCLHKTTMFRTLQLSRDKKPTSMKQFVDRAVAARECAFLKKGQSVKTIVDLPETGLACVVASSSPKCLYVIRQLVVP